MADEVNFQFFIADSPERAMAQWRASPPEALKEAKLELIDESVDTLVYKSRYLDWPQKITIIGSLGFALLFKGFMTSSFTLSVRFDSPEPARTRITIHGTAHPKTRAALRVLADANGGPVGLAVGI